MARTPSISSVQDFERARLSSATATPPFGPPYAATRGYSLSDSGSEDGAQTPGVDRQPSYRPSNEEGRTSKGGGGGGGDGWFGEDEGEVESFGLEGGGPRSPPATAEKKGLKGMLLKATTRSPNKPFH